jgi:2-phosphosulfolactate phosphatase
MFYDQSQFDVRCEWGERGVHALAPGSDAVIIVDVFSFSTTLDIALARGAIVFPSNRLDGASAQDAARDRNALLVGKFPGAKFRFSPKAMADVPSSARLLLPSANGAAISLLTGSIPTLSGCLRNRRAVAEYATKVGRKIAVIPCGERWEDNSLRPGVEDWIAAGSIIEFLPGTKSPEAATAVAAFQSVRGDLESTLRNTSSGRELRESRQDNDATIAAEIDCSQCIPRLVDGAYVNVAGRPFQS